MRSARSSRRTGHCWRNRPYHIKHQVVNTSMLMGTPRALACVMPAYSLPHEQMVPSTSLSYLPVAIAPCKHTPCTRFMLSSTPTMYTFCATFTQLHPMMPARHRGCMHAMNDAHMHVHVHGSARGMDDDDDDGLSNDQQRTQQSVCSNATQQRCTCEDGL